MSTTDPLLVQPEKTPKAFEKVLARREIPEHYPAERCYNDPARVVDEFLAILAKHRR